MGLLRRNLTTLAAAGAVAAAITLFVAAQPASAITGGEPDGEAHPNVGVIVFYDPDGRFRCSATLVTPTVLVTAAHCTTGTLGRTLVSFNSTIALNAPSPFPLAGNPSLGYTTAEITGAGFIAGTASTHPNYSNFTDLDNWNDVGVVVLDTPLTIGPATMTPANYLDAFGPPKLSKSDFLLVGYGTEVRKPDSGPQKPSAAVAMTSACGRDLIRSAGGGA